MAGADPRLECAAAGVTTLDVLKPAIPGDATRAALQIAIDHLGLPIGPGESCTNGIAIDLPASTKTTLRLRAALAGSRPDSDTLKLTCLPTG